MREAELATPRWREDPAQLIAMLASAMRAPPGEPERALARARAQADAELARLERRLSSIELAVVRALVDRAQQFTRLRERMRTWVTRVLGMLRAIALDVDRRLRRIDPTLPDGGVFFCTYDELLAALASGRAEIGAVVRLRHAEFARDAARPDPPPTFIGRPTILCSAARGRRAARRSRPRAAASSKGAPASSSPARVGLDAVRPGEVLISRTTDVGLSPLFLVAAAVVTELGGPLSHAAVVAREYGIPAVVSVARRHRRDPHRRSRSRRRRSRCRAQARRSRTLAPATARRPRATRVSRRWIVRAGDGATIARRAREDGRRRSGDRGPRLRRRPPRRTGRPDRRRRRARGPRRARPRRRRRGGDPRATGRPSSIADKPAGLATTQDRRGGRSLVGDLASALGLDPARVHPASRLDVGVSGVVVCCLDDAAIRAVEEARSHGAYTRVYVAIASARIDGAGVWDAPIGVVNRRGRAIHAAGGREARPATTRFFAIAPARGATLLRLEPITGRTHQLRVHAAHANAPLFGDRDHGGPRTVTDAKGRVVSLNRVALHALSVHLPGAGGVDFAARSPIPPALRALWNGLDGAEGAWDSVEARA